MEGRAAADPEAGRPAIGRATGRPSRAPIPPPRSEDPPAARPPDSVGGAAGRSHRGKARGGEGRRGGAARAPGPTPPRGKGSLPPPREPSGPGARESVGRT